MGDTATTLPADMLSPAGGLVRDVAEAKAGIKAAGAEEAKAVKEENAALGKKATLIGEQRKELKDYDATHPFPKPDIKPWTAKPPENNPIERFGSWASAFGILAGAITKTGLASSLNASAAAMNAMRQNDLAAYDEAHKAWKENTDIAIQQAEWEAKSYEHGWELMQTDQASGLAQLEIAATQAHNTQMLASLKKGDYKTAYDMSKGLADFLVEAPARQQQLGLIADQNRRLLALNKDWLDAHPGEKQVPPDVALQNRVKVARESQVAKPITANEQVKLNDRLTNYEDVFDAIDFVKNNLGPLSVGIGGRLGRPVESIEEVLDMTDDATRARITGALERIKNAYPNLKTGTTRQLTAHEDESLQKIVGGQYAGATVKNTTALLNDLENSLMTGYNTTKQELGGGAAAGVNAPPPGQGDAGPQEGDTATNAETKQKMVFHDGEWRKMDGATGGY